MRQRKPEPKWNVEVPFTADEVFDALIAQFPGRFKYCGRFRKIQIAIVSDIFRARLDKIGEAE